MDWFMEYLSSPDTIVTVIVFVFWLGATWSNLNWRIKALEKRIEEIDVLDLIKTLRDMQKDIEWIKKEMENKYK